ncbi:MAG: L,D-transpeptidase, partial [Proteobacteria bacterium]|nr:L,D-transpeptidase [Pseudomonadota bacterium]
RSIKPRRGTPSTRWIMQSASISTRKGSPNWIHARDLSGRPASHGCVGVFDEAMQHRVYGVPDKPVLEDTRKLYAWTIGEAAYREDNGTQQLLSDGPPIEIAGDLPKYLPRPPK